MSTESERGTETPPPVRALYTTTQRVPGGFVETLVTIYEDGTAEIAYRPQIGGWLPPTPLQSRPIQ